MGFDSCGRRSLYVSVCNHLVPLYYGGDRGLRGVGSNWAARPGVMSLVVSSGLVNKIVNRSTVHMGL